MSTKAIPDGYATLTPYLHVRRCAEALAFYKAAFGAEEVMRMEMEAGKIGHAEMRIGSSMLMLADEHPEMNYVGPETLGGTSASIMLYCEDCDAVFASAVAAGATVVRPLADQFYGDRMGLVKDPFGHLWTISTHKEDVTVEEMERRMASFTA